jgi:hypothetical protein
VTPFCEAAMARQPASGMTGGHEKTGTGRSSSANANGTIALAMFSGATP